MPKLSHDELQQWYANFKKIVYEKANIDMDRVEDIGRLKAYYFSKWNIDKPLDGELDFRYACIPHQQLTYDNPPPTFEDPDKYLDWVKDNLQVPTTDEQIEKLYDMSRDGSLMIVSPGVGDEAFRQVYTNENGEITTTLPMDQMVRSDTEGVAPERLHLPEPRLYAPQEPDPASFGLDDCPSKPVPPSNPNPGFLSWLGYLLGFDTEYAKKVRYEREAPTYADRWNEWYQNLDDQREGVRDYKAAKKDRDAYVQEVEAYMANPLGKAGAISYSLRAYRFSYMSEEVPDLTLPTREFLIKEKQFMSERHSKLPQGQIQKNLRAVTEQMGYADRTKNVVRDLLGAEPVPNNLYFWVERGVFKANEYNPKSYELPKHPNSKNIPKEERDAFNSRWRNLADIAGFAALSHPSVTGNPAMDGFSAEETAKLNYSMVLSDMITAGRGDSSKYLPLLDSARTEAQKAIEAYGRGEVGPLADLLRNSIRMTNREAACLSSLDSAHSMNTLYLIGRMWNVLDANPDLKEAVGLSAEEIQETQANMALHSVMVQGLEAKQALLEYALYQRDMTPEQLRQAGTDVLLAYRLSDDMKKSHEDMDKIIAQRPEYKAAEASLGTDYEKALQRIKLIDQDRPPYAFAKKLLSENWIKGAKDALIQNCSLDQLATMSRDELGKKVASQIEFRKSFDKQEVNLPEEKAMVKEIAPVKESVPTVLA